MTAPASVHPRTVEDLLPGARDLRDVLGRMPSRNQLMREFHVGAPKADALRDLLVDEYVAGLTAAPAESAPDPWDHADPIGPTPMPTATDEHEAAPDTRAHTAWDATPPAEPCTRVSAGEPQVTVDGHPDTPTGSRRVRPPAVWPVVLLALPAFVAIWSGWVGLGGLTGFGVVHPLPGIWDSASLDTAITLPIGVETYGAYALYVWLSGRVPDRARRFARWSAIGSLLVGALGQVAYHLLVATGVTAAPWWITTAVSVLPVAVLGMGAALAHLVRSED